MFRRYWKLNTMPYLQNDGGEPKGAGDGDGGNDGGGAGGSEPQGSEPKPGTNDAEQQLAAERERNAKLQAQLAEKDRKAEEQRTKELEEQGRHKEVAEAERKRREAAEAETKRQQRTNALYQAVLDTEELGFPVSAVVDVAKYVDAQHQGDEPLSAEELVAEAQKRLKKWGAGAAAGSDGDGGAGPLETGEGGSASKRTTGDGRLQRLKDLHQAGKLGDRSAQKAFLRLQGQLRADGVKIPVLD